MKKEISLYWLIFLALIIRLYKMSLIYCIAPDGMAYINAAKDLIEGNGFNPTWPPLYPFFLSVLWKIIQNPEVCGQIISILFGVLNIVLVYKMSKELFGGNIAFINSIFMVFHPFLVRYSAETLADSLFTFLITLTIFTGWFAIKKENILFVFLTGFFSALSYLAKPEGVFLLVIISFWRLLGTKESWRKKLASIAIVWVVFLVICFPYLHSIKQKTGEWMISQKQSIVFSVALKEEGYTEEYLDVAPLEFIKKSPKEFLSKVYNGYLKILGRFPDAYNPFLFILFLAGLLRFSGDKKYLTYVLSFLAVFFTGYAIFNPGRRYLVGWVPLTLFIASYGIENINNWFKKKISNGRDFKWAIVTLVILLMLPRTLGTVRKEGGQWKEAGTWIKKHAQDTPVVMCEDPRTAFYAGGKSVEFNENGFSHVDYIVTEKSIVSLKQAHSLSTGLNIYYGKLQANHINS